MSRDRRPPPLPNRRADDPRPVFEPRRRMADLGPVERAMRALTSWTPLFSLLTLGYLALGFRTIRPNDRLVAVEGQLVQLKARRDSDHVEFTRLINAAVESLSRTIAPTVKRTSALARYRCLHLDPETAYQLDLDCDVLLPGYQRFQRSPDDEESTRSRRPARGSGSESASYVRPAASDTRRRVPLTPVAPPVWFLPERRARLHELLEETP